MNFWRFIEPGADLGQPIAGHYNVYLVIVSFAVATLGAYTALETLEHTRSLRSTRSQLLWTAIGALSFGSGIWGMHFLGMVAFDLPASMTYDVLITAVSILPAILASVVALWVMKRQHLSALHVQLGALLTASGIGGMHYLGMEAMSMENLVLTYDPGLFILSILVAHGLALLGLYANLVFGRIGKVRSVLNKVVCAGILGSAIACMHYTAMAAARFLPNEAFVPQSDSHGQHTPLVIAIVGVIGFLSIAALVSSLINRKFKAERSTRLEAEKLSQLIIESAVEAFIGITTDGRIMEWNAAATNILGWSRDEAMDRKLDDFLAHDSVLKTEDLVSGTSGLLEERIETDAIHKTGRSFPIEITLAAFKTESDDQTFYAFLHDISKRKEAEQVLKDAKEKAESTVRAKSEFLANMSHEIRTPMNAILGMSGLLLDTDLNKEQLEYAETISRSSDALLSVINDVLDFSKIESGKLDLEIVPFDIRTTVDDVMELLSVRAHEKEIELLASVAPDVPQYLSGDPGRLRQILLNLIGNAIKFTNEGEILLLVETEKNSNRRKFRIFDTGIGIPKDRQDAIFESFTQADASTTRHFGGTGLGLSISKNLAELMGGEMGVESEEGKGSTFWFEMDLEEADSPEDDDEIDSKALHGTSILIVDDNATGRSLLKQQVEASGASVTLAESGHNALDILNQRTSPFDAMLIDYHMPVMDGQALAKQILEMPRWKDVPLIILTSSAQRGEADAFAALGFSGYLTKPVKPALLLDTLNLVLSRNNGDKKGRNSNVVTRHTIAEFHASHAVRLLVVDDNMVNQRVAQATLKKLGFNRCDLAANGIEAIEALNLIDYDLIFMDCQMPEMDGFEATKQIRTLKSVRAKTPIVAMTANARNEDRDACLAAGMDDYISKPFTPDDLKRVLTEYLDLEATPTE